MATDSPLPLDDAPEQLARRHRQAMLAGVLTALCAFAVVSVLSIVVLMQYLQHPGSWWWLPAWLVPSSAVPALIGGYAVGTAFALERLTGHGSAWEELRSQGLARGLLLAYAAIAGGLALIQGGVTVLPELGVGPRWTDGWTPWIVLLVATDVALAGWQLLRGQIRAAAAARRVALSTTFIVVLVGAVHLLFASVEGLSKGSAIAVLVGALVVLGLLVIGLAAGLPRWRVARVLGPCWRGDFDTAIARAEDQLPIGEPARAMVAALQLESGDVDGAAARLQAEVPLPSDPAEADPYVATIHGWILLTQGHTDEARRWFQAVTDRTAGAAGPAGLVRIDLEQGTVTDQTVELVEVHVDRTAASWVVQRLGGDTAAAPLALRAWVYAVRGREGDARTSIGQADARLRPEVPTHNAPVRWYLGQALRALGDDDAARQQFQQGTADPGRYGSLCREALAG